MNIPVAQLSFCQRVVDAAKVRTDKVAMMVIDAEGKQRLPFHEAQDCDFFSEVIGNERTTTS